MTGNVIYCINPNCSDRQNSEENEFCQACCTPLAIENSPRIKTEKKYRLHLIKPLQALHPMRYSDVFEVRDIDRGDIRVLKVLKTPLKKMIELFQREALILRQLNHPGIPKIWREDYFIVNLAESSTVLHCLCMPKIEGITLKEWLSQNNKITQYQALDWLQQIAEILNSVHQSGFFHRDIKPSNIMLQPDSKLALIDFGGSRPISSTYLAKLSTAENTTGVPKYDDITTLVSTGYTPLEQFNGKALPQSDFYALGRTLIRLTTGKEFHRLSIDEKTGNTLWRQEAPQIAKPLADFIDELCAIAPTDRPKNTQEILNRLQKLPHRIKRYRRFHSKPYQLLAVILTALVLVGLFQGGRIGISRYFFRLASESESEDNFEEAQKHYEWAIFFDPHDYASYNNLGLSCQFQKKYNCAIENFGKASELEPDNEITFYNAGGVFEDVQDYKTARLFYEKAIKISKGKHLPSRNNLARLDILEGDPQKALVSIQQVLGQDASPLTNASLYKNLGWAQFKMEQYDKALVNLERSIELDPDEASTQCLLAQTRNKKKLDAQSHWKLCLFLNSDLPEVWTWKQEFIDRLENMP